MNNYKTVIREKICYTELVYQRINKKLKLSLSKDQIEELVLTIIEETDESNIKKKVKKN